MVKEQQHINQRAEHLSKDIQDISNSPNFADSRQYHPASYIPPPYSQLDQNIGMTYKVQQQLHHPAPNFVGQASKFCHQFLPLQNYCQSLQNSQHYNFNTGVVGLNTNPSASSPDFRAQGSFCDIRKEIVHHVPYNLTTGQYEYWLSMPGTGRSNSNCEAMQAYWGNQHYNPRSAARHIPVSSCLTLNKCL